MVKLLLSVSAAAVGFVACSCIAGSSERTAAEPPPPVLAEPPQRAQNVNVTETYDRACANCHGRNGEGGGAGTKSLLTWEKYDQKHDRPFFDAIKKGVPEMGMEAFGDTMADEVVWAMVVHIRELQARALRSQTEARRQLGHTYGSRHHRYRIEEVASARSGFQTPWALDWLPDGRMLVTNRPGFMNLLSAKGEVLGEVTGLPESREIGQGGLMDVAVHPEYARNGWIYLGYTEGSRTQSGSGLTKIVRGKLRFEGGAPVWTGQQTVFEADQEFYTRAGVHFGTRIVFDGKGNIYFVIGERGGNMMAQRLDNPFGKIFRVREDGAVPSDNPFFNTPDNGKKHVKAIWSYGHRNPQGLVQGLDGVLWCTEHGPRGGDELNVVSKGANYGWPVVAFSINYNDSPFRTPWPKPQDKITQPVFRWLPSIGACGLDVLRSAKAFPKWSGDLFAGGLSGANVDRFKVSGGKVLEREEVLYGMGRVRDVVCGPDGYIYVVLNQPDKIVRIVPAP